MFSKKVKIRLDANFKNRPLYNYFSYNQLRINWNFPLGTRSKEDMESAFTCRFSGKWSRSGKIYRKESDKTHQIHLNLEERGKEEEWSWMK